MQDFEKLEKMLCKELEEMSEQGKLSAGSLDVIHKLTDTVKNLKKIEMLDGEDGGEYSQRYYRDADGNSYAPRRGSRYVRGYYRDGDRSYGGHSYEGEEGGYSGTYADRDRGYSGVRRDSRGRYSRDESRDHIISRVGEMMSVATTSEEREALEKCLRALQNA